MKNVYKITRIVYEYDEHNSITVIAENEYEALKIANEYTNPAEVYSCIKMGCKTYYEAR